VKAGLASVALAACAALALSHEAAAQRSGKEVVESTCARCHGTGEKGAPKIGDRKAWGKRSAQGLSSLTQSALKGLRNMPAHGGNPGLSDLELARAIAYMVTASGGKWTEPKSAAELRAERTGAQVVKEQCSKCHQDGKAGAPKIGDRSAWNPRLKDGLERAVQSAIRGHGGMPPRGERADLTDGEIRNAVVYMVNPGAPAKDAPKAAAPAKAPASSRTVDGMEVHLGLMRAEALRAYPEGSAERSMHGGVPSGAGYYHVNVSVLDAASKAPISDARVEIRVEQLGGRAETRTLERVAINNATSYGGYVRLSGNEPYSITVQVRKPGAERAAVAKFQPKL
jgi:cytochrome c5